MTPDIGEAYSYNSVLAVFNTNNDITNTTTETDLFSVSIPANMLGTDKTIRAQMTGTFEANSGTPTMTFKVIYGTTTMFQDVSATLSASAVKGALEIILYLQAHNATNSQELGGAIRLGNRAAPAVGVGDIAVGGTGGSLQGAATEDSTTALNFKMTLSWSAANSTYHCIRRFGLVELLRP